MKCPICSADMIWNKDSDYEDLGVYDMGIVSFNTCDNEKCNVENVHVYTQ